MQGTTQNYTLDMADGTAPKPLIVKQGDTNSREARISLIAFKEPWTIPFGCQIHINVRKKDMTYANATCTQEDEHTVLAPITEQMTTVPGTQLGELFFLGTDGDIRSQTFPLVVWDAVSDLDLEASSNDFQALKDALRDVKISTDAAGIATQYATEQGNAAGMAAQRAEDAADSIQAAVDAAAAAKACESNARDSELAAAQTQQEVTDYVEAQKAAFVGYSKRESDSKYANAITATAEGEGGVTVEDAWTAPVLDMEVAGRSEQVVTTGAQLLDLKKCLDDWGATYAQNGNAFTVSAIGYAYDTPFSFSNTDIQVTLSGSIQDISGSEFTVDLLTSEGVAITRITKDKQSVTATASKIRLNYSVRGIGKYSAIMLNAGDTPLPYEPYTGGAPSPSPDYPQDIISTGTVSTGAQLLDTEKITHPAVVPTIISDNGRTIQVSGSGATGMASYEIDVKKVLGKKIYVSGIIASKSVSDSKTAIVLCVRKADGTWEYKYIRAIGIKSIIYTQIPIDAQRVRLDFNINDSAETLPTVNTAIFKDVMLNTGDTALLWEPYTGGKPAPSVEYPQTLEVTATGANLFGGVALVEKLKTEADATVDGTNRTVMFRADRIDKKVIYSSFEPGKEYTVILYGKNTNTEYSGVNLIIEYTDGTNEILTFSKIGDDSYCVYHTVAQKDVANITGRWGSQETILYYDECGVFEGNISIDTFEPYRSASASITLTEPLRGIGDYRDRIICRDGAWGVERWFIPLILDGSEDEDWGTQASTTPEKKRFVTRLLNAIVKRPKDSSELPQIMCSHFSAQTALSGHMLDQGISVDPDGKILITSEALSKLTVDEFRSWLQVNTIYAIFERATPTWEPFDDATQQALNALTTYAGTTHLTIIAGGTTPSVTLDYVKDTHKALKQCQEAAREYTDNQIAAIVAALPTATQAAIVDNQTTRLLQEVERL